MVEPAPGPSAAPASLALADDRVLETALFLTALHSRFGADFRGFNPLVIKAKLDELVLRRGLPNISVLQGQVLRDPALGQEVIRLLGSGPGASLNDARLLAALRFAVVPILRSSPWPAIWIADCSDAGLVVLVAALLKDEGQLERTQLYVTSADDAFIEEMHTLRLPAAKVDELDRLHQANGGHGSVHACLQALTVEGEQRGRVGAGGEMAGQAGHETAGEAGGEGGGELAGEAAGVAGSAHADRYFTLGPSFRASLSCHVHDLASDASFREFETVVCARALREYGFELQQRALGIFSDSLCGFGVLQIDPSSAMRTLAAEFCFAPVLPGQGLYRRLPR